MINLRKNKIWFLIFSAVIFSKVVNAQSSSLSSSSLSSTSSSNSSSSSSSTEVPSQTSGMSLKEAVGNKKFEDTHEITDPQMRAQAGSLSRYSVKFDLNYKGPVVSDPLAKDQPNPDGNIGNHATAISGNIGARYRLTTKDALSMGTGIEGNHPLQGMDRFDVRNPFFGYDHVARTGGFQLRESAAASAMTVPENLNAGQIAGALLGFGSVYDIGSSRYSAVFDSMLNYVFYNRDYQAPPVYTGKKGPHSNYGANVGSAGHGLEKAQNYTLMMLPGVRYSLSDRWNFGTSLVVSYLNPRSAENETVWWNNTVSQRLSVGYAWSRDIYIAPYVNLYPGRFSWDTTTVNLSTIFSVL